MNASLNQLCLILLFNHLSIQCTQIG